MENGKMAKWLCKVLNTKHTKLVKKLNASPSQDDVWIKRYVIIAQSISKTVRSIPQKYKSEYIEAIKNFDSEELKKFENMVDMEWAVKCHGYEDYPTKFREHLGWVFMTHIR